MVAYITVISNTTSIELGNFFVSSNKSMNDILISFIGRDVRFLISTDKVNFYDATTKCKEVVTALIINKENLLFVDYESSECFYVFENIIYKNYWDTDLMVVGPNQTKLKIVMSGFNSDQYYEDNKGELHLCGGYHVPLNHICPDDCAF